MNLLVQGTVNVNDGFVYSLAIRFSKTDSKSLLSISTGDQSTYNLTNLRTIGVQKWSTDETEASWETVGVNRPTETSLKILVYWILTDKNTQSHGITITLEVVYFSNGMYQKVFIPITLGVLKR